MTVLHHPRPVQLARTMEHVWRLLLVHAVLVESIQSTQSPVCDGELPGNINTIKNTIFAALACHDKIVLLLVDQ